MNGSRRGGDGRGPAAVGATEERDDVQHRFEQSAVGWLVVSTFIVVMLLALLATNLPTSELKDALERPTAGLLDATALTQRWNLFAPDPRRSTLELEARLHYPDGDVVVWRQPDGDPVVGAYRSYRWRKWANNVLSDRRPGLWSATADWLARTKTRNGEHPVEVHLVRRWYFAPTPGHGDMHRPDWNEKVLYIATYGAGR